MSMRDFVGKRVEFEVSEPADFFMTNGNGPFIATIENIKKEFFLLKLDTPITYQNDAVCFLIGSIRHKNSSFEDINFSKNIIVYLVPGIVSEPTEKISWELLYQTVNSWRGWFLIGSLSFVREDEKNGPSAMFVERIRRLAERRGRLPPPPEPPGSG